MPSSPGPNDYTRRNRRFFYRGIQLLPQDALAEGKAAFAENIRSYQEGTVTPRYGMVQEVASVGDPIHTLIRLNDTTPFGSASPETRLIGAGATIYREVVGSGSAASVDTGYSGNPLTAVVSAPVRSPRPMVYVGDSLRQRKFTSSGGVISIGLPPPDAPPTATLTEPQYELLNPISSGNWTSYGGEAVPVAPTPTPIVSRVNTTVSQALYDSGSTGMASFSVSSFENIVTGTVLEMGAGPETVIVQEVHPAVSPTTIAAILYDVGTSGLCTIQPDGSFSIGQTEAPSPEDIRHRYRDLNEPSAPKVTVTRTIDYPVGALVLLGGTEVVRILSVAVGTDGVQSFRCVTSGTFGVGAAITGIPSFRAWTNTTIGVGNAVTADALQVVVTALSADNPVVGGVQSPIPVPAEWMRVGDRAVQPEDLIRVGIRVSLLGFVEAVRILLDVSPLGPEFLRDYYFYEWRASDLIHAIQATGQIATERVADGQAAAVEQGQVDSAYADQFGFGDPVGPLLQTGDVPISPGVRRRSEIPLDGLVSIGAGLSRQLALGNDVWMTLECRVGDLARVGTDTTLTLSAIRNAAVYVQMSGTTTPITIEVSDPYLTGGYGPDVGPTLAPYVYRYRYRSTATGETGNPSPTMRAGVPPRRNRVDVSGAGISNLQCDIIDIFRFGGALARWAYVGSTANTNPWTFSDDMADRQIEGGEGLRVDLFQPWPTSDQPRQGFCNVAGTAVERVSGDSFDAGWSADSLIIVNGRASQLYRSPASTDRLEVIDNVGDGTNVPFSLPSPTLKAQPLPALWGGPIDNVLFHFACGDPVNPGMLHWSHGNNPDAASDAGELEVTSASEPLQNGVFYDGIAYVFSTERLYRILPDFGGLSTFRAVETACTKGLWNRWGLTVTPYGIFFIAKDGIYLTQGGDEAKSIIDPDLRILFPQEGTVAEPIRNLFPVDFSQPDRLQLSWVDQTLYFDYVDTEGNDRTFVYEPGYLRWTPDVYTPGIRTRLGEQGPQVHTQIVGGSDGAVYRVDANQITDVLTPFEWQIWTPWENGDDPRAIKQWGDAVLDFHPGGTTLGVEVTPVTEYGNQTHPPSTLGIGGLLRRTHLVEVSGGIGVLSQCCGLQIRGECDACDPQRPLLYFWEPSWIPKQVSVARRATDWEDLGYKGAKFVQGVVLRLNTFGHPKQIAVQYDGPNQAPQTALVLVATHDGEREIAYPLAAAGWNPFIAHLVRLQGDDDHDWTLLDWRFIWEPAPELATQWETQYTTFDLPGFLHVHDGVVAYQATAPVTWFIEYQDGDSGSYVLPASAGLYRRVRQITEAQKGKAVRFRWTSDEPFRLFKRDMSVRVQGWGLQGGYQSMQPFGGPSRVDGAEI